MAVPTHIPAYSLPDVNRRVLLTARPNGIPQASDFTIDQGPIPELGANEALVRTIYWSVDPAQRGWASAEANYSQPVALGSPMRALGVGVVVRSTDSKIKEGGFYYGWFGWQDYAAVDAGKLIASAQSAIPLSAHAGLLGINGLTAYLALTELGRPKAGDTVLVSTAAGAVGSLVGQIARHLGCRTIGLTGSDDKVALCRSRYGYDAAFNYKTVDLPAALKNAAPSGLNIYFDNTGGNSLDTALRNMAVGGRIVQCGTASNASWTPVVPTGPRVEREMLTRRLIWSGFVIFDHVARFEESSQVLAGWHQKGMLVSDEDIVSGIEHAPGAIASVYAGENRGKKMIYVG